MKYIKIIILISLILSLTLKAQEMSILTKASQSGWYPEFLHPVLEATLDTNNTNYNILDIGTGPGSLPEMLVKKDSSVLITAIDIDSAMITNVKARIKHKKIEFKHQQSGNHLDFTANQFDVVTICSVLFLLDENTKTKLMEEAFRVVKPNGKVIVLTPSGQKCAIASFVEVWRYPFSWNNFTFPIWKIATTGKGRKWNKEKWLKNWAFTKQYEYTSKNVFNNNATIEIITKK